MNRSERSGAREGPCGRRATRLANVALKLAQAAALAKRTVTLGLPACLRSKSVSGFAFGIPDGTTYQRGIHGTWHVRNQLACNRSSHVLIMFRKQEMSEHDSRFHLRYCRACVHALSGHVMRTSNPWWGISITSAFSASAVTRTVSPSVSDHWSFASSHSLHGPRFRCTLHSSPSCAVACPRIF